MDTVGVIKGLAVDNYLFVDDFNPVSFKADNPLYVIEFWVPGILENNNIISCRLLDWNELLPEK